VSEVIVTKRLMAIIGACYETRSFFTHNNLWDKTENDVLSVMRQSNMKEEEKWWFEQKDKENFVRFIGKELTMGKFQVFNPLTGAHKLCETEIDAKNEIAAISKAIIENQKITICRELSNEHGHTTWIAYEIPDAITISPNL